ncbi:MAG: ribonuclease R [Lentimicrobiaceae bacterium]|nr:ribonuclease R [Lentimicrobiaceae bacterium]
MSKKKSHHKKANDNPFLKAVEELFLNNPFKGYNFRQVAKGLNITDKYGKDLIKNILDQLAQNETIIELNRGKFKYNPDLLADRIIRSTLVGKVDMKSTGKAYVSVEELTEDIYIAPNNTAHALNGDTVRVHLFPMRKGRQTEGEIIEVLERSKSQFVGIVHISGKFAFLIPDDSSMPVEIFIPRDSLHNATHGVKAIARITDWPQKSKNPFGEITRVLGKPGDNNVEMQSILASFEFPLDFKPATRKDAERIDTTISQAEINSRRDFRNTWTCTIDPADAKDFDDALSLKKQEDGLWEVGIHIADVSHYVKTGSALDQEAYERGTSVYLVDRTIPMLPEILSNNVCSLRPNEDKLCFSAVFIMNDEGKISNEWLGKTIINSNIRYNYEEVQAIIEGGESEHSQQLLQLHKMATALREARFKNGAIAFNSQEVKFILDEQGKPIDTYVKVQKESNMLIEDFMLLANRKVAEKVGMRKQKNTAKAFVYRIHDEPNPEKLEKFAQLVAKLGYRMNLGSRKGVASSFNHLFDEIAGKGEETMIETLAVRTMSKAEYSTENVGHYGLAFAYYTHFTSPIRRYPDLMVHRLLDKYLSGKPSVNKDEYEEYCIHCSEMERKAIEAERASVKYKQAEYLQDRIGERFSGLISGVSKYGLYVELDGNKCEGMVSLRSMDDDFYYLDEDNYKVIGQHHGREFRLGDPVKVKVKHVDLQRKQMDFVFDELPAPKNPKYQPTAHNNKRR